MAVLAPAIIHYSPWLHRLHLTGDADRIRQPWGADRMDSPAKTSAFWIAVIRPRGSVRRIWCDTMGISTLTNDDK